MWTWQYTLEAIVLYESTDICALKGTKAFIGVLPNDVVNNLFFAGVATHLTSQFQTVQGALQTGESKALKELTSFNEM